MKPDEIRYEDLGQFASDEMTDKERSLFRLAKGYREQAYVDYLTNLPNFRKYSVDMEKMFSEFSQGVIKSLGTIGIDVVGLKKINDEYTRIAGNDAIRTAGKIMNGILKTDGHVLYRVGGDEFASIGQNTEEKDIEDMVEVLKYGVSSHGFRYRGYRIPLAIRAKPVMASPGMTMEEFEILADPKGYRTRGFGRNPPGGPHGGNKPFKGFEGR